MDGVFLPRFGGKDVASIKGVLGEEQKFERGWTRLSLQAQARLECRRAHRAGLVLAPSRYAAEAVRTRYGVAGERVRVVPEPIDLKAWCARLAAIAGEPPAEPVILCVAHLYPRKDVATLLRAMALLRQPARLRVVGGGPELERLREAAHRAGPAGRVVLTGHVPLAILAAEYHHAQVFCLPSRQEAFGIVLLEAMAAGLPIVAAGAAAVPELIRDGENGRLFPAGDAAALAAALDGLLVDEGLRTRLVAGGRAAVMAYDAPVVAERFLAAVFGEAGGC